MPRGPKEEEAPPDSPPKPAAESAPKPAAPLKPTASLKSAASTNPEYLVLSLGTATKAGSNVRLLAVEDSLKKAIKAVEEMTDASFQRLAIVEKKAVLVRKPAIVVDQVDENIVP